MRGWADRGSAGGAPAHRLAGAGSPAAADGPAGVDQLPSPPALFYGRLIAGAGFTPAAGTPVTAWIGDHACGESGARSENNEIWYGVKVLDDSDDGPGAAGCGATDRVVRFRAGTRSINPAPRWSNERAWRVDLAAGGE